MRKKYVALTPEEWVRQHWIAFLVRFKNYPKSLIAVEAGLHYNQMSKRADIVVYNRVGEVYLIVEVKAPTVKLDQDVLNQIAAYHKSMPAKFLVISNGIKHYCMQTGGGKISFWDDIPVFEEN